MKIQLRTLHDKRLIQPAYESNVFTRSGKSSNLTRFTFVDARTMAPIQNLKEAIDKKIGIKSAQGLFLSSENGKKPVRCNRKKLSTWETFIIEPLGENKYAFMGNNQKWLSSENGYKPMRCDRDAIKEWEQFVIKDTPEAGVFEIYLRNHNNKKQWITVVPTVIARRSGDKEKSALNFIMLDDYNPKTKSRKVAIQHIQSKAFLSSENGLRPISFSRQEIKTWETFILHGSHKQGVFSIQGNNKRYISAGTNGEPMYCGKSYPKAKNLTELFYIGIVNK